MRIGGTWATVLRNVYTLVEVRKPEDTYFDFFTLLKGPFNEALYST